MRRLTAACSFALLAFVASASPALAAKVEVTRFHTPATIAQLGRAVVAVVPAPGTDTASLENRVWLAAVERALAAPGFALATPGTAQMVAEVRAERRTWKPERRRGGVDVGVGGSTGSYGSGVGLGIGINLGGGPAEQTESRLSVVIRDKASGQPLWEGRAVQVVKTKSRDSDPDRAAAKLANALFAGFPGRSGDTITVK